MASFVINVSQTGLINNVLLKTVHHLAHVGFDETSSLTTIEIVDYVFGDTPDPANYYRSNSEIKMYEFVSFIFRSDDESKYHNLSIFGVNEAVSHQFRQTGHRFWDTYKESVVPPSDTFGLVDSFSFRKSFNRIGETEIPAVKDNVNYFHIRTNNLVYDIKNDSFTKFADIGLNYSYPLIKGNNVNNVALCLMSNNNSFEEIKQFPGSGEPEYSSVRTKDYYIEHGVFQAFNVGYDRSDGPADATSSVTTITKNADSGEEVKSPRLISDMKPNKWGGYFPGAGYGFIGSIVMQNVYKVKELIIKYKLRLEG